VRKICGKSRRTVKIERKIVFKNKGDNMLKQESLDFLEKYYKLEYLFFDHFNLRLGIGIVATNFTTHEIFTAIGSDRYQAEVNLFAKIPSSSIRENQTFLDSENHEWFVNWACGEKIQMLKKNKTIVTMVDTHIPKTSEYQEELMIYIYKGLEFMSFDYRLHNKNGGRLSKIEVPTAYEKVVTEVVERCFLEQKHPQLLLKKPKTWRQWIVESKKEDV